MPGCNSGKQHNSVRIWWWHIYINVAQAPPYRKYYHVQVTLAAQFTKLRNWCALPHGLPNSLQEHKFAWEFYVTSSYQYDIDCWNPSFHETGRERSVLCTIFHIYIYYDIYNKVSCFGCCRDILMCFRVVSFAPGQPHFPLSINRVRNSLNVLLPWWRHQMKTFSAWLALFAGDSPAAGEFHVERLVTRSFDFLFDLRLNKRLVK